MFSSVYSLGIDFRDDSLRLACLSSLAGKISVVSYACLPLVPLSSGGLVEYENVFIEAVSGFVANNKIKADKVVVGLPQKDVICRRLQVPAVKHEEIRQILEFEIERHVPFALNDVYFDFQVIGAKEENKLDILLVAVRKERINYLLSLFQRAGLDYPQLELTTHALFSALNFSSKKTTKTTDYIVLDLDSQDVEIAVAQKGKFVFAHSFNRAAAMTLSTAVWENTSDKSMLDGETAKLADRLCSEISVLLTSLQKNHGVTDIGRIVLCGASASAPLAEYIKNVTQIEAGVWSPLSGLAFSGGEKPEGAVAVSLALHGLQDSASGFNLLSLEEQEVKNGVNIIVPIVLGAVLLLLTLGNGVSYFVKERIELEKIEEKIIKLQSSVLEIEQASKRYQQLQAQVKNLQTISYQPVPVLEALKELTVKLPSDVWLEVVKMNKKEVEIGGYADAASSLIPVLEASPLFKDVKFTSAITSRGEEQGKEKFTLQTALEYKE